MAKHYIIMSSSYTDGTRVALDITEGSLLNSEAIEQKSFTISNRAAVKMFLCQHILLKLNLNLGHLLQSMIFFLRMSSAPSR